MGSDENTRRSGRLRVWMRRAVKTLLVLAIALVLSIALFRFVNPPITPLMVAKWLSGYTLKHRWVPLDEISRNLTLAAIASEDAGFCTHWGIDPGEMKNAIQEAIKRGRKPRGASTITMQTVKNLYLWPGRSWVRKGLEAPLAVLITLLWPKERVIETYLNIVQWGPGIFGAEAASQYHFHKKAADLTRRESVLLALSLPAPNIRNPARPSARMRSRTRTVESDMQKINASCLSPFQPTR